jgi:hypothetical protein
LKIVKRTSSQLVLRQVTLWLWVMGALGLAISVSGSREFAVTCQRHSTGGWCDMEQVIIIPLGEPYRIAMDPIDINDIEQVSVGQYRQVTFELRDGRSITLPIPPKQFTPEEVAARLNAFLQAPEVSFIRVLRDWPARLAIPALVLALLLLLATFISLTLTCTVDKESGQVILRRRNLLFARQEVIPLEQLTDVEVQYFDRRKNTSRICFVLTSGERKPMRTLFTQHASEHLRAAEALREFLGLPRGR